MRESIARRWNRPYPIPANRPSCLPLLRGMWRRHKLLMAAIFLGVSVPLLTAIYLTHGTTYISSATLSVETSLVDQIPGLSNERVLLTRRDTVASFLVLLKGRSVSEDVVHALPNETFGELLAPKGRPYLQGATNFLRGLLGRRSSLLVPEQRAADELQGRTDFETSGEAAGIFYIRAKASTPKAAMDIVNTYIQVLMNRTRSGNQEQARKMREFLESQFQQAKAGLAASEASLTSYERQKGRIKLGGQTELDLARLSATENALADVQASQQAIAARVAALQKARDADRDPRLISLKKAQENLSRLEAKYESLRTRYTDAHPQLQLTQEELIAARARVAQLARGRPEILRQTLTGDPADIQRQLFALEGEGVALKVRAEAMREQVDRLRKDLGTLSQEELEFTNLRRAVEADRNLITVLSQRLVDARMREQAELSGFRIMDPASYPNAPSREYLWKFMLYALGLAAGCALAGALGLEKWREPVETEPDVESLALPLLGSVATFSRNGSMQGTMNGRTASATADATSLTPVDIHHEMYRAICATIETVGPTSSLRSFLLTSPGPGEGKSTTAINLAYAFQEFGRRVLVIEADLRRPVLARQLGLPKEGRPDLVQFLQGTATFEQVCQPLPGGVTVIPGSIAPGNATTLLASVAMRNLLKAAVKRFDIVLCDSAPVLAVPDNILLIKAFEAAIVVVKASATSKRQLAKTAKLVALSKGRIIGVVLNHADPRDVDYYHHRYRCYYRNAAQLTEGEPMTRSPLDLDKEME